MRLVHLELDFNNFNIKKRVPELDSLFFKLPFLPTHEYFRVSARVNISVNRLEFHST